MSAAIRVVDLAKRFRIPLDRGTTLKYRVVHLRSSSRFHEFYALRGVSFDIGTGEFVGIIGPNGCGKSTLLKILSRIYYPTSGTVEVNGRVSPFLELGVGFNPELTARENVFVNGALLGLSRAELSERFDSIIDFAELREFVDQKLKNFSSGMQVRLAFSVAIQADAPILLMDEVLAVGDARFQERCLEIFWKYKRQGKTVVLVTHDLTSVEEYCDRAILLDHGTLVADDRASVVTRTYLRMINASFDATPAPAELNGGTPTVKDDARKPVRIDEVKLLDGDGHPTPSVRTGGTLAVEIDYHCEQEAGELVCAVDMHRADGLHLGVTTTRQAGIEIPSPVVGSKGRATFVIDRLPLHAGSYLLSVAISDRHTQHVYDSRPLAIRLRVTQEDASAPGLLDLSGRWTVQ